MPVQRRDGAPLLIFSTAHAGSGEYGGQYESVERPARASLAIRAAQSVAAEDGRPYGAANETRSRLRKVDARAG
jgi:hypothetical protein